MQSHINTMAIGKRTHVSVLLVLHLQVEPGKGGFSQWVGYSAQCVGAGENLNIQNKASISWWTYRQPPRAKEQLKALRQDIV